MSARGMVMNLRSRRALGAVASLGAGVVANAFLRSSSAGASSRLTLARTTSTPGNQGVLLGLGAGVLVLGGIGFVVFTYTRRKRRPNQCAEQREALELAERAVRYWEAARAPPGKHRKGTDARRWCATDASAQANFLTKAVDGLNSAMRQRDQCQLDLIRCMATGPAGPVMGCQSTAQPTSRRLTVRRATLRPTRPERATRDPSPRARAALHRPRPRRSRMTRRSGLRVASALGRASRCR